MRGVPFRLLIGLHGGKRGGCQVKPQRRLVEPFYFSGNRVGCLLIHGFRKSNRSDLPYSYGKIPGRKGAD